MRVLDDYQNTTVLYSEHEMNKAVETWKELKRIQLVDEKQSEEDRRWEEEFIRRRQELEKQRQISSQRRLRSNRKLTDLSARWRNLEQKRVEKNDLYLDRLRTSLSIALRTESMSSGSPYMDR
ncbi:uncharacterized protein LOC132717032 isoform X2 [Ruditapes philippinarum]|uniref:uncharacterized protein LOC132717032 isoform X2 n=1 Tax=Ruditapes philippinarum TaxID=129788 RepID=UPI00295B1738|nr:uncharacterized protein LOC132717032 isoform X2 [Ruditapes philippinarum]